ncbi:MAG: ABC transporter ATP-binding protein [Planctomycetota bacterium]
MSYLDVFELSKSFGKTIAVSGIDLSVQEGELLVLLGTESSGKTTLLRCIAGLEKPDCGTIELRGEPLDRKDAAARDMTFVFQDFSLYPRRSVFDNLALPLKSPRDPLPSEYVRPRVETVARQLRIEHLLERAANGLSVEEQRRAAIARALVRRPKLFLFDEPLSGLDSQHRALLEDEIFDLQRSQQTTMIYATSDREQAMSLADRIAVLDEGRILQIAAPSQIYDNPEDMRVALALGSPSINLIPVRFEQQRLRWIDADRDSEPPKLRIHQGTYEEGATFFLGVRPEDVVRVPHGGHPGTVLSVSSFGSDSSLHLRIGDQELHSCEPGVSSVEPGQPVHLAFRRGRLHLFEERGTRLSQNIQS